ncbi:GumC family protein [Arachidicoccus sp.]|uniref:GumC family protein n=1 Tax=Arachidicoccus sp. TaxID=1872624 RepID=UPI003D2431F0
MQAPDFDWLEAEEDARIDFPKIIHKIKINWIYCLLCSTVLVGAALFYLHITNSTYNAVATVLIKDNTNQLTGQQGTGISTLQGLGLIPGTSNVDNEQQIITSYPLIHTVVEDLQLNLGFSTTKQWRQVPLYKETLPFQVAIKNFHTGSLQGDQLKFDFQLNRNKGYRVVSNGQQWIGYWGKPLALPFGELTLSSDSLTNNWDSTQVINLVVADIASVSDNFQNSLSTEISDKQSTIINLSLPTMVPEQGTDFLNRLLDVYQLSDVDDNKHITDSTIQFINQRLILVGKELDSIEQKIQLFKQNNNLADLTAQSQALITNAGLYQQNYAGQQVQISIINSLIEYMNAHKQNEQIVPASLAVQDGSLVSIIDKYNSLLLQKERLLLSATKDNPVVQNIETQITSLRGNMMTGLQSIKQSLQAGLAEMQTHNNSLDNMIREVPAKERTFVEYSRQQSVKQELYLYLLQKREEALISKSSTISNIRIIAPGRIEAIPLSPHKSLILAFALLLGIILPFVVSTLRNLANVKINTREDIEKGTKAPVLAEIPHNHNKENNHGIIVTAKGRTPLNEQFRILRTDLNFILTNKNDKVILLTSSMPSEGKSFVSQNLSAMMSFAGKKVVILEMDLRRPRISRHLLGQSEKGFTNYAIGQASLDEIIYPVERFPGLSIVPSGPIPPNPAELIMLEKTEQMFAELRNRFDYIIVDTTPCLVADAHLLGRHSDVTLFLVRVNVTYKEQLTQINKQLVENKFPRLNILVNDVDNTKKSYYYGYGRYGYYGGSYFDESEPKRKWKGWPFKNGYGVK